jgi:hypothetical protein
MRLVTVHRYSHEIFIGPIPDGMFACHRCDNRGCFNSLHIFAGTPEDNVIDMIKKGRQQDYVNAGIVTLDRHRLNRIRKRVLMARQIGLSP